MGCVTVFELVYSPFQVKMIRATSFTTRMPEYDIPVVDKAVDATWKREVPRKAPFPSTGFFLSV
jgi:hypothetical protein